MRDTPSIELRSALFILVSWLCILVDTASPAASSADEFIRSPEESLSIEVRWRSLACIANVLARIALVFVLIVVIHTSPVRRTAKTTEILGKLGLYLIIT